MNSETIDLIYLDPPFNSQKIWKSKEKNAAKHNQSFTDTWEMNDNTEVQINQIAKQKPELVNLINSVEQIHSPSMKSYLSFMAIRIIEMHRILKNTGSLYLHCDDSSNSYLRLVLDYVFGQTNGPGANGLGSEITWKRSNPKNQTTNRYGRITDTIYYYKKTNQAKTFNQQYVELSEETKTKEYKNRDNDPRGPFNRVPLISPTSNDNEEWIITFPDGVTRGYKPDRGGWRINKEKRLALLKEKKLYFGINRRYKFPMRKLFLSESLGEPLNNLWTRIKFSLGKQDTGWTTQKPTELLKAIIRTSTNEGDLVFDPFSGCGTTIAACILLEKEERYKLRFIGCDVDESFPYILANRYDLKDLLVSELPTWEKKLPVRTDAPLAEFEEDIEKIRRENVRKRYGAILYTRQDGKCAVSGERIDYIAGDIDHKTPLSQGGSNDIKNLQFISTAEHRKKTARERTRR